MKKHQVLELFQSAKIEVLNIWKIPSRYWPEVCENECMAHPWWLVKTRKGLIEIGRYAEDIQIDWKDIGIQMDVIDKLVPKGDHWVRVKNLDEACQCLKQLGVEINRIDSIPTPSDQHLSLENHPKFEEFIRTFWREIQQFEDNFPGELPAALPIEIRASVSRAFHILEK